MNDLIPIAFFVGCLLATFGLMRMCEWLRPISQMQRGEQAGSRDPAPLHGEEGQ
ncbi:MAG TPA: hypothetical protein VK157_11400 [Phycisphaerales bacterium]|nr:hypothetical protein [Phycisphaerales bacterium]